MSWTIKRKRLRNSPADQPYACIVYLGDGIKIQIPASKPKMTLEKCESFMAFDLHKPLSTADEGAASEECTNRISR